MAQYLSISAVAHLRALVLILLISVSFASAREIPASAPIAIRYREVTGDKEKYFSWIESHQQNGSVIISLQDGKTEYTNICTPSGETLEWTYHDGQRIQLRAWREEGQIFIKGHMDGEPVEKRETIDDRPWYQSLSFSLRGFLDSSEHKTSFWTIRANTLDIYALEATKIGRGSIETTTGMVMASQVEVRAEGLLSALWHATYWYRQEDGLFLRYQSVHGPVGTEETTVNIASVVAPGTGRM